MASSHKRRLTPTLIPNPFIKKRNLEWALTSPSGNPLPSQSESSSSPAAGPPASPSPLPSSATAPFTDRPTATTADVESGAVQITDHLAHFSSNLSKHNLQIPTDIPRLSISDYSSLYKACASSPNGAHFVIHQHDHPIAGTHYDLRLQINETSSVSWAIMYGLPGDPNSIRLNRNATETRIHSLWNHLIETASPETGSLLIWDTGTYSILPRRSKHAPQEDPSSPPDSPQSPSHTSLSPQSLLHAAFQNRKIRLRLHGTKLPDPYVLNLRLTKSEDATGRSKSTQPPKTRRRRGRTTKSQQPPPETSSDSDDTEDRDADNDDETVTAPTETAEAGAESVSAMDRELRELEDAQVRLTNAYPGASNTIGSIHQRRWYLSLDRRACGFVETRRHGRTVWELPEPNHDESSSQGHSHEHDLKSDKTATTAETHRLTFPFYVRGPDHERSVITGRRGSDILQDEGVSNFVPRKGWIPVLK